MFYSQAGISEGPCKHVLLNYNTSAKHKISVRRRVVAGNLYDKVQLLKAGLLIQYRLPERHFPVLQHQLDWLQAASSTPAVHCV